MIKTAIILASGKGERMLPFTQNRNKCMFKVFGMPLLQWHIVNLLRIGIDKIIVTCHWKSDEIGVLVSKYDNRVRLYYEHKLEGSGTAVSKIMKVFKLKNTFVINGDTWYSHSVYDYYLSNINRDKSSIFIEPLTAITEKQYITGLVCFDEKFNVKAIRENGLTDKDKPYYYGKNIGILYLKNNISGSGDLMKDVLPKNIKKLCVVSTHDLIDLRKDDKYWCDIGELDSYIEFTQNNYYTIKYLSSILDFSKKIINADRIFICGNGGSMHTAQHIALDWSKVGRKKAIALGDPGIITAYGNDESFEYIFVSQLERHCPNQNDVIVLLSGSGNSPNIKKVIDEYKDKCCIVGMSGNTGYLKDNVEICLSVPSKNIRVIEDSHLAYGHAITEVFDGLYN